MLRTAAPAAVLLALGMGVGVDARAESRSTPRCYGAAARDPLRPPCKNRRLRLKVEPRPSRALLDPGLPCTRHRPSGMIKPCSFGARASRARGRLALVGDSHGAHWRSGVTVVARKLRWRGYAITRNSCPFTTVGRSLPEPFHSECEQYKAELPAWLAAHPGIKTIFMAQLTRDAGEVPFDQQVAGYVEAWRRLPPSVEHVVVIRDTPEIHFDTLDCVSRAIARRRPAGRVCAVPRAGAIAPDPAATAAVQIQDPRFQVADLTPFFCDDERCYPVVGGVLVYKDITHITPLFAKTLGPFLLREYRRLFAAP
jgi:hypothetical protein